MLSISIDGLAETDARLTAYPAELLAALAKTSDRLAQALLDKIKSDKLSGGALNAKSGALAASISANVVATSDDVVITAGSSGVPYAAIQEYGGRTSAHEILPSKAMALAFAIGGETHFARRVKHPGSQIPERSYLRSSLAKLRPEFEAEIAAAVDEAWSRS